MHRPLSTTAATVAGAALLAAALPAAAAPAARKPTRPWATVNVCDPPERPGDVGVRAFVPRRPATTAEQWIRVRLQFRDAAGVWRPVRSGGDGGWSLIGTGRGDVKGGRTFTFPPPGEGRTFTVRGIVHVEWRRAGRLVARTRVRTTAGHADRRDPQLAVSRRICVLRP